MQLLQHAQNRIALLAWKRPHTLALFQVLQKCRARFRFWPERHLRLRLLLHLVIALLQLLHVRQNEFRLNHLRIAHRINRRRLVPALLHVNNVIILEAPHHMQNRIALANVRKKLIPKSFALTRTLHKPRNVRKPNRRTYNLLRRNNLRQILQPRIIHFHDRRIRLNRAKRIILRRRLLLLRQRVKQSGLTDIRQPNNTY